MWEYRIGTSLGSVGVRAQRIMIKGSWRISFHGQKTTIMIFSTCASTGDSSTRGIEFLFSCNRLNVAISRAQTLAIVVGNPALVRTSCSTLDQMRLVNVYCRAVQEGAMVATAPGGRP